MNQRLTFELKQRVDLFVSRARDGVLTPWPPLAGEIPEAARLRFEGKIRAALATYRRAHLTPDEHGAFDEMLVGSPYAP
jgi:hypothetical protein